MSFLGKFSGMIVRCVPTKEREESHHEKQKMNTNRMVMLSMFVAVGVVISPILRVEGMCPTAHLVNIVCAVFLGPWYSLLCATMDRGYPDAVHGNPAACSDRSSIWSIFIRCFLPCISWKDFLCCVWGDFRNRNHRITCILSGHGISDGKRWAECIFLYTNVSWCNLYGRSSGMASVKSAQQKWSACKNSMESWSESI